MSARVHIKLNQYNASTGQIDTWSFKREAKGSAEFVRKPAEAAKFSPEKAHKYMRHLESAHPQLRGRLYVRGVLSVVRSNPRKRKGKKVRRNPTALYSAYTLSQMKTHNRETGGHWFEPGAMRFFNSKLYRDGVYPSEAKEKTFFVTSEQYDETTPRLFSVRVYDWNTAKVDTVGEFQGYRSLSSAKVAAKGMV